MVAEAQVGGLWVFDNGEYALVQRFLKLDKAWQNDLILEIASCINQVMNAWFVTNSGYKSYIESKVMKVLTIEYDGNISGKWCTTQMLIQRKSEMANTNMKKG